jgi:L-ascorbate metabolism protein UlaG (beta-lactamase superfamily)
MKTNSHFVLMMIGFFVATSDWPSRAQAPGGEFARIQRLTNKEIALTFWGQPGTRYRFDVATNLPDWSALFTSVAGGAAPLFYTDSAAPFLGARYYRAEQVSGTNVFLGDHLVTTNSDIIMQPRYHATLVISWQSKVIYVDPDDAASYPSLPKADLILLTHTHGDHLSTTTIDAVRGASAVIIAPQDVYIRLTVPQQAITHVLAYGLSTNLLDLTVTAIPAYGPNHTAGLGNGYVLAIAGKRVYISGDSGNTAEMRALSGIDVAFIAMNQPYTMTVTEATNAVTAFLPKVVYPYHYRDQSGAITNAAYFKQQLSQSLGVEVRLRNWY